jgi:hypothetical protein
MSTTTPVSGVSGVQVRLADQARPVASVSDVPGSSPPSRRVSLADSLARLVSGVRLHPAREGRTALNAEGTAGRQLGRSQPVLPITFGDASPAVPSSGQGDLPCRALFRSGSSRKGRTMAVARNPGQTALTLMRSGAKSRSCPRWCVQASEDSGVVDHDVESPEATDRGAEQIIIGQLPAAGC